MGLTIPIRISSSSPALSASRIYLDWIPISISLPSTDTSSLSFAVPRAVAVEILSSYYQNSSLRGALNLSVIISATRSTLLIISFDFVLTTVL